jgi:hypothetical protein
MLDINNVHPQPAILSPLTWSSSRAGRLRPLQEPVLASPSSLFPDLILRSPVDRRVPLQVLITGATPASNRDKVVTFFFVSPLQGEVRALLHAFPFVLHRHFPEFSVLSSVSPTSRTP